MTEMGYKPKISARHKSRADTMTCVAAALFIAAFALIRFEESLAEAQALWCDFEQFIVFDKVDRLFETKVGKWRQLNRTIA